MIFSWGNAKSSDNGQDIEYLLKIGRIRCKFNVFLTSCVKAWSKVENNSVLGHFTEETDVTATAHLNSIFISDY